MKSVGNGDTRAGDCRHQLMGRPIPQLHVPAPDRRIKQTQPENSLVEMVVMSGCSTFSADVHHVMDYGPWMMQAEHEHEQQAGATWCELDESLRPSC